MRQHDTLGAVHPSHRLSEAARSTFSMVATFIYEGNGKYSFFGNEPVPLFAAGVVKWVTTGGASMVTLGIADLERSTSIATVRELSRSLQEKKPILRRPSICAISAEEAGDILRSVEGHLLELKVDGHHVPVMADYCLSIRNLVMRTEPNDIGFLRTVGRCLELLRVEQGSSDYYNYHCAMLV